MRQEWKQSRNKNTKKWEKNVEQSENKNRKVGTKLVLLGGGRNGNKAGTRTQKLGRNRDKVEDRNSKKVGTRTQKWDRRKVGTRKIPSFYCTIFSSAGSQGLSAPSAPVDMRTHYCMDA